MNEVISIVPNTVNESLIELLEELLARAKDGQILDIAGCTMNSSAEFGEFYTDDALDHHCVPFIAYLRVLQLRFERQIEI